MSNKERSFRFQSRTCPFCVSQALIQVSRLVPSNKSVRGQTSIPRQQTANTRCKELCCYVRLCFDHVHPGLAKSAHHQQQNTARSATGRAPTHSCSMHFQRKTHLPKQIETTGKFLLEKQKRSETATPKNRKQINNKTGTMDESETMAVEA